MDKLAAEYGLEIEKHNVAVSRYKQWKDAEVMLFLPGHAGTQAIVCGEYPSKESYYYDKPSDLSIWSKLAPEKDAVLRWHKHEFLCNDIFNERYLREVIEASLKIYHQYTRKQHEQNHGVSLSCQDNLTTRSNYGFIF